MPSAEITHRQRVPASELTVEPQLRDHVRVNIAGKDMVMRVEQCSFGGGLIHEVFLAGPV